MLTLLALHAALAAPTDPLAATPPVAAASPAAEAQGRPPPPPPGPRPPGPRPPGPPPNKRGHPQPDKVRWESEPFLKPEGGAQINANGQGVSTFLTVGASAGLRYWQVGGPLPSWNGQTRVRGGYGMGSGVSALDARVGSFIGPRWRVIGLQFGPDLFWNRLEVEGAGDLDPSVGLEIPLNATARVSKQLSLMAGFSPAWLMEESRAVDWSEVAVPGFGDEFSYMAGASLNLEPLHLSVSYVYRIVATGAQQNLGFGVNFGL